MFMVPQRACRLLPLALLLSTHAGPSAWAEGEPSAGDYSMDALLAMPMEELLKVEVVGVLRKEEDAFTTPSALYILGAEDIRRSGATTIAELLRLVPGMHVGRINGSSWSINARGGHSRFSHELLVLLDGRLVYSPLFNGVYWNRIDTFLPDIERIEIIRGPGASLWGSNAANGIVNIVTRNAADSTGGLAYAEAGTGQDNNGLGIRYGLGGNGRAFRVYAKGRKIVAGEYPDAAEQSRPGSMPSGAVDHDGSGMDQAGFRADWELARATLTLQGDVYGGDEDEVRLGFASAAVADTVEVEGANLLGRYRSRWLGGSSLTIQSFLDYARHASMVFEDERGTFDLDMQYDLPLARHQLIWGLGFRLHDNRSDHFDDSYGFALDPADRRDELYSLFVQDEFDLIEDRLQLLAGLKYEYNAYTASEWQPSLKLSYTPKEDHNLWASVARAVSVPSRVVSDGYLDLNAMAGACAMMGGTNDPELGCILPISESEVNSSVLISWEAGYRYRRERFSMDHALYYTTYPHQNSESDYFEYLYGYEGVFTYRPGDAWRLELSYAFMDGEQKERTGNQLGYAHHALKFRQALDINPDLSLDLTYAYESEAQHLPEFHKLDLHAGYRLSPGLSLDLSLINLFDEGHVEHLVDLQRINTVRERAALLKLTAKF